MRMLVMSTQGVVVDVGVPSGRGRRGGRIGLEAAYPTKWIVRRFIAQAQQDIDILCPFMDVFHRTKQRHGPLAYPVKIQRFIEHPTTPPV